MHGIKLFYGDGMSCAINSQNDQICYTEYTYGAISKSTDGGLNWSGAQPPGAGNQNNYCFVTPFVCCNSNPNVLYAGGKSIYKSTNGAGSWTGPYGTSVIGGTKILSMANSNSSVDTVYCGAVNGKIFRSVNAGLNWTDITDISVTPDRYATDMTLNPNNSGDIVVTFGGFNSGHVFRSVNGGSLWQDISGNLPDVPHHCVVLDPVYTQNIYVGNDLGVYVTTNGGTNWHEYRSGMPYALVFDLTVVNANRQLRIATYGNGIWERKLLENPVSVNTIENQSPGNYKLNQNYPNPFNPNTIISFSIPSDLNGGAKNVKLMVYSISGKEVMKVVNQKLSSGSYQFDFNGNGLPSGVYFYNLTISDGSINYSDTKCMILLK
ncbi:MAG: T9SS type A sorting domain-containing protein [Ignavibacteria bacterium]